MIRNYSKIYISYWSNDILLIEILIDEKEYVVVKGKQIGKLILNGNSINNYMGFNIDWWINGDLMFTRLSAHKT